MYVHLKYFQAMALVQMEFGSRNKTAYDNLESIEFNLPQYRRFNKSICLQFHAISHQL